MSVHSQTISFQTSGYSDIRDITDQVMSVVRASGIPRGIATVFVPGSTGGITTIEFEEGAVSDLKAALERLVPASAHYRHDARWGDGNGVAHVRAALLGPSLTIPILDGSLTLGTWQQIVFMDFDTRPRQRTIQVQIVGDSKEERP